MLHPMHVLFIVMAIGMIAFPLMKYFKIVESNQQVDLIIVAVLILSYVAYKRWWQSQNAAAPKPRDRDPDDRL
jgi:hypothetical protein